jgi:hypothetical protein
MLATNIGKITRAKLHVLEAIPNANETKILLTTIGIHGHKTEANIVYPIPNVIKLYIG